MSEAEQGQGVAAVGEEDAPAVAAAAVVENGAHEDAPVEAAAAAIGEGELNVSSISGRSDSILRQLQDLEGAINALEDAKSCCICFEPIVSLLKLSPFEEVVTVVLFS